MRYKLNYDGMWHLDIPKTRQYDHGKVEVIARNVCGESRVETMLSVKSRHDDYRGVLKNSPRRMYQYSVFHKVTMENALNKYFMIVGVIIYKLYIVVQVLKVNNAVIINNIQVCSSNIKTKLYFHMYAHHKILKNKNIHIFQSYPISYVLFYMALLTW